MNLIPLPSPNRTPPTLSTHILPSTTTAVAAAGAAADAAATVTAAGAATAATIAVINTNALQTTEDTLKT